MATAPAATGARLRPLDGLGIASLAFVAANLLHTADHFRQGTGRLDWEILVGGSGVTLLAFATLWFTLRHDPRAPLVAAVVGLWSALGIAASHLAPHWSALSDPYPSLHVDALSWAVMLAEIAAGLALGVLGVVEMRRRARSAQALR